MSKFLILSTAALLLSGSLANADNPLIPNDNDHKAALGFAIERTPAVWSGRSGTTVVTSTYRGGGIMMPAGTVSRASSNFLQYRADGDNK